MNAFGKWLFALLVLANVGLWLWTTGVRHDGTPPAEGARAPLHPDKMRLLDEPGAALVPHAAAPSATACYRIGPFDDAGLASAAGARLEELLLAYDRRTEEQPVVTGYRVFLPPLSSREAAEKKRRELVRLGFKDSAVMQEEGAPNAISLGLFTVEANARKRLRALAAKKVEAQLQTLTQARRAHWLMLGPADNLAGVVARLRETDWGDAGVKIEEISCPAAP